jgi:hypothetical protein
MEPVAFMFGFLFDLLAFEMYFLDPAKIDIRRDQIIHWLMVAIVVAVLDKLSDRLVKFSWRVEVLQLDDVLC